MLTQQDRARLTALSHKRLVDFIDNIYGISSHIDERIRLLICHDHSRDIQKIGGQIDDIKHRVAQYQTIDVQDIITITEHIAYLQPENPHQSLQLSEKLLATAPYTLSGHHNIDALTQAYQKTVTLWLQTAGICYEIERQKTPDESMDSLSAHWQYKIKALVQNNDDHLTKTLLTGIGCVLCTDEMMALLADFQAQYDNAIYQRPQHLSDEAMVNLLTAIEALSYAIGDVALFEQTFLRIYAKFGLSRDNIEKMLTFFYEHDATNRALYYLNEVWRSQDTADKVARLDWLAMMYDKSGACAHKLAVMGEALALDPVPARLNAILQAAPLADHGKWHQQALDLAKNNDNVVQKIALLHALGETKLAYNAAIKSYDALQLVMPSSLHFLLSHTPKSAYITRTVIYRSLIMNEYDSDQLSDRADNDQSGYLQELKNIDHAMQAHEISYQGLPTHEAFMAQLSTD